MIEETVERWHRHLRGELPGGLDALLHDEVVFYSPVVFTPQRGKAITKLYLQAALEFETRMDGKVVNGVDLITCDAEGRIVEFKVMIRPLQAVHAVHGRMRGMLESMAARESRT